MSRSQPPAFGRPSAVAPKHTSRVRRSQSGASAPTGHSASAHHDAVIARIAASAPTAIHARAAPFTRSSRGTTGSSSSRRSSTTNAARNTNTSTIVPGAGPMMPRDRSCSSALRASTSAACTGGCVRPGGTPAIATPVTISPSGSPKNTDFTAMAMNRKAPVAASSPPSATTARMRSTIGLNCTSNGAWLKLMSQCRRGTPKLPANVIDIVKMSMPPANRYGWIFASLQNATLRWKISGMQVVRRAHERHGRAAHDRRVEVARARAACCAR